MARIFISYSRDDSVFADQIADALRVTYGQENVWYDQALHVGDIWWNEILHRIEWCDVFIYLISSRSLGSPYCQGELQEALRLQRPILGIIIQRRFSLKGELAARNYIDLSGGIKDTDAYLKLLQSINKHAAATRYPPLRPEATPLPTVTRSQEEKGKKGFEDLSNDTVWRRRLLITVLVLIGTIITLASRVLSLPDLFSSAPPPQVSSIAPIPTLDPVEMTFAALLDRDMSQTVDPHRQTRTKIADENTLTATNWTATPSITQTPTRTASNTRTPTHTPTARPTLDTSGYTPLTNNSAWIPQSLSFDGVTMMLVPAGCFMMGTPDDEIARLSSQYAGIETFSNEAPHHEVCFDAPFWIDRTEVTQAQFQQMGGTKVLDNVFIGEQRPVGSISWFEARDYCARRRARLPTEAEWEYAARGPDGLVYPWGNEWVDANAIHDGNANQQTADVGSRKEGASWVGALDMIGNVWEWTSSLYQPYPVTADDGRETDTGSRTDVLRTLRGGSGNLNNGSLRAGNRSWLSPFDRYARVGFRCARDIHEPTTMPTHAPTNSSTPAAARAPTPYPVGNGTGLLGEYYDDPSLSQLVTTRIDSSVNFNWNVGSPAPGIGSDNFSVRWRGQVEPRFSGSYAFTVNTDDGARLWVDGRLIIDAWRAQSPTVYAGSIDLVAGQRYDLVLEYYENTVSSTIQLYWSHADLPQQIIPASQLYPAQPLPLPTQTPTTLPVVGFGSVLYREDFSEGDLHGWSYDRNIASIVLDGGNRVVQLGGSDWATIRLAVPGSAAWRDYTVEMRGRVVRSNPSRNAADFHIGVRDSSYGYFRGWFSTVWNNTAIDATVGNTYIRPLVLSPLTVVTNQWYTIRVEVLDNRISLFIDGAHVASTRDDRLIQGTIHVSTSPGALIAFDDVRVFNLTTAPSDQVTAPRGTVTANAHIRSGPGTNFNRISGLQSGERVYILDWNSDRSWVYIRKVDSAVQGWVAAQLIAPN